MRLRFAFWLDLDKPAEYDLAEVVDSLKQTRQFSQVIRDGLRIIPALLAGNPDPLLERFPWVIDMVLSRYAPPPAPSQTPTTSDNGGGGDLSPKGTEALQSHLNRIERLLMEAGAQPIAAATPAIPATLTPPKTDDIDIGEIRQASSDKDNNSVWNLIIASALNIYGNYDGLAPEVIEYGLRTRRISPDMVKVKPTTNGNAKAIVGADRTFAAPVLDDFELDIQATA